MVSTIELLAVSTVARCVSIGESIVSLLSERRLLERDRGSKGLSLHFVKKRKFCL